MRIRPLVASVALALSLPSPARASDDWFGADKAKHFGATFVLSAAGYGGAAFFDERPSVRLATGALVGFGAGVAKELWDLSGHGDPSWKDLTWDAVGTATGLLVSYAIDRLWHRWFAPDGGQRKGAYELRQISSIATYMP